MAFFAARDGTRLHYHDLGRGDPVVLLHGFAMPASLWLPFALPLAARYRFILPDLRGFGGSHAAPLRHRCLLTQYADDVADLLATLDLHGVRLGGLSMGACTALQYHRLYDFARVQRYLHIDQSPCLRNRADWRYGLLGERQEQQLDRWQTLTAQLKPLRDVAYAALPPQLRRELWRALSEFFGDAFHLRPWKFVTGLVRHETLFRRITPTAHWPIVLDSVCAYLEHDYDWRPTLPQLRVPMTVLIGRESAIYPAAGQLAIAELVPHARVVTFDRCGHAVPFEAPQRFGRELRRFLAA